MSCMISEKGLDLDTAIRILENIEDYETIHQPPIKPKGGEVFIYLPNTTDEQENYKCDQYRWLNSGPKEIPRKNPLVKKQYFIGKLPTGKTQVFQKHCYALISDQRNPYPILLHYIGDESIMVDFPHGNSKKTSNAYFAIAPSVRKEIANRSANSLPTAVINSYKDNPDSYMINEDGGKNINPVLTPRNKIQVRNIRRKQKLSTVKQGIPNDDLDVLHSLGAELVGFAHYIRTKPDFLCIVGVSEIKTELENLLKLTNNTVVFSFLENYKVGRYTITPFNFIHSAFSESPTIPCYFLISEQMDFFIYEKFLHAILETIPGLNECQTAVITNQDYHFASAISAVFPDWLQVYDWEILFAATRAFLRKINIDIKDISLRIKQIKNLMCYESQETYNTELEKAQKAWSSPLIEYYAQVLSEQIQSRLGRWVLEKYRIYTPQMGCNRGINGDLHTVIKQLQELKDASLDVILPSLFHLQTYLYSVIKKSFCGKGKLNLHSAFNFLKQDADELALPSKIYEPSGIVRVFRVRGITLFSEDKDITEDESNSLLQAQRILEIGNISHSSTLKAFLVKSTSGSLHGVQLFPRESCSCSINQRCAHIMAVMMALGMPVSYDKRGVIKVLKPQVVSTQSEEAQMELLKYTTSVTELIKSTLNLPTAKQTPQQASIVTPANVTCTPDSTPKTFEEIAAAATSGSVTPMDRDEEFDNFEEASGADHSIAVSYTPMSYTQAQVLHVNGAQLGNVLQAAQNNEILMVVDGVNQVMGEEIKTQLLTYEGGERLVAYATTGKNVQDAVGEGDANISSIQVIEGELRVDTDCMNEMKKESENDSDQISLEQ